MRKKINFVLLGGIIVLVVALSISYLLSTEEAENASPESQAAAELPVKPEVGFLAPDFELTDLDGKVIRLSELRGQPVFINFWATWCPPCRQEMPDIQKAYEKYGKTVRFLAVNLTATESSIEVVRQYMSGNGYTFPALLDKNGSVATLYQVRAIPTSFFIDAQGVIQYKYIGAMNAEIITEALDKITPP